MTTTVTNQVMIQKTKKIGIKIQKRESTKESIKALRQELEELALSSKKFLHGHNFPMLYEWKTLSCPRVSNKIMH